MLRHALLLLPLAACARYDLALLDCRVGVEYVSVALDETPDLADVPSVADALATLQVPWTFVATPSAPLVADTWSVEDVSIATATQRKVLPGETDQCPYLADRLDVTGHLSLREPAGAVHELPVRGYLTAVDDRTGWSLTVYNDEVPRVFDEDVLFSGTDRPQLSVDVEAFGGATDGARLTLRRVGPDEAGTAHDRDVLFDAWAP